MYEYSTAAKIAMLDTLVGLSRLENSEKQMLFDFLQEVAETMRERENG